MPYIKFSLKAFTAALVFAGISASAQAGLVFDFSITNTQGTVAGTVTGEILGLSDNSTGAASQVIIETYPASLNSIYAAGPIDATSWDEQMENSFTVSNGEVVAADFWAENSNNNFPQGSQLYINAEDGYNFVNIDGSDSSYVWGDNGFASANIVPGNADNTSVPEPATLALMGLALAALALSRRQKQV